MSIEAMKQAVEAFEAIKKYVTDDGAMPENWDAYHEKEYFALEALRQAIEQAEKQTHTDHPMRHWDRTCPACVAEAEKQEPYADKANQLNSDRIRIDPVTGNVSIGTPPNRPVKSFSGGVPWYATDAPKHEDDDTQEYKKPWVNLTDEEIDYLEDAIDPAMYRVFARRIEAKLKEKNHD
jgi:hypothetical protein